MTREETRAAILIMEAYLDGYEIQHRMKKCDSRIVLKPDWCDTDAPWWDFDSYEYRIKPTAKLRPWTADEVPLGAWIRSKVHSWKCLIIEVDSQGRIGVHGGNIPLDYALQNNEHSTDGGKTWLPCGVVEESK